MKPFFLILAGLALTACGASQPETTQVYIDNGGIQCEFKGKAPLETAAVLDKSGVTVSESYCAYRTGVAVAAMCGTGDLNIHVHRIAADDLAKAESLGFRPLAGLAKGDDPGFARMNCPE